MARTGFQTLAADLNARTTGPVKGTQAVRILESAADAEGLTPAQKKAFLATAYQESNWTSSAVGDGGTSFGFFQHHAGGAGGPTIASAKAYLDPYKSARERARHFKAQNITTGKQAAALQRPADPRGYAAAVDQWIRKLPSLLGGAVGGLTTRKKWSPARDKARQIAQRNGLRHSSGDRTPARNAAAGGVKNSSHLSTNTGRWADDYVGTQGQMAKARGEIQTLLGPSGVSTLIHNAGSGVHLHVEGPSSGAASGPTAATVAADAAAGVTTEKVDGPKDGDEGWKEYLAARGKELGVMLVLLLVGVLLIVVGSVRATGVLGATRKALP